MAADIGRQVNQDLDLIYSKIFNSDRRHSFIDILTKKRHNKKVEEVIEYDRFDSDFIISIPHAGRLIPFWYFKDLRNLDYLIEIDMYSDKLYDFQKGIVIKSNLAPFIVDMNRSRLGADNVPDHLRNDALNYISISEKPVLKRPLTKWNINHLVRYYDLYHKLLSDAIQMMINEKGYALVLDGHSMTSIGLRESIDKGHEREDFDIGTLGGKSVHPKIISAFHETLSKSAGIKGLTVEKNKLYTGGFITRKHADTKNDVHVIQLEVNMDTYMHEGFIKDEAKRYKIKKSIYHVRDSIQEALISASTAASKLYGK